LTELLPFTLQSSTALTTLLALLVPLIIHLLSKSRGRLVPFAHIALIKKIKQQPMRQIRMVQRLLLFLRMLMLLLAALLLAHLFYLGPPEHNQRQVLLTPDWLAYASSDEKQQVAKTLPVAGASLLTVPVQKLSPAQILTWQAPAGDSDKGQIDNVWAQASAQLSGIPTATEVDIYSTNRASQFTGEKVAIQHKVKWHIKALPPLSAVQNDINILVLYDGDRSEDLTYIRAALAALQKNSAVRLAVKIVPLSALGEGASLSAADVIVYLSSAALSAEILARVSLGQTLLMDAAQTQSEVMWAASTKNNLALRIKGTKLGSPAHLDFAKTANGGQQSTAEISWQTDNQQTLLTEQGLGQGHILAFHSRFNPAWNNLVTQLPFPLQLGHWLLAQSGEQYRLQQTRLSDEQIQSSAQKQTSIVSRGQVSLNSLLALLLVLCFIAERLISEWQRPTLAKSQ
jgi:hypothetical protein